MNIDFSDLHVVVTGGTGTLGSSVTRLLLDAGAQCSIPCYHASELDNFSLRDHERLYIETGIDLTNEEAVQNFYMSAVKEQGALWASVHIAGGFGMGAIESYDSEKFKAQFNLNTVTCYNSCRAAVHWMRDSNNGGRIVNIASRPALEPRLGKGMTAYTVSKAGVAALTASLAAEVVDEGILVNAVAPSVIDTPANRSSMPDANFDKWPKPVDIASQILHLASPQNTVTRGAVIPVYGKS